MLPLIPRLRRPRKLSSILKRRKILSPRCRSIRKVSQSSEAMQKKNQRPLIHTISWIHSVKKPMLSKKSLPRRKNKASTSFSAKNNISKRKTIKRNKWKRRLKKRENKKNLRKSKMKKLAKNRLIPIKLLRQTSRKLKTILLISKTC
jgi:hypothetical protein